VWGPAFRAVGKDLQDEFEELFPMDEVPENKGQITTDAARVLLLQMAGWLDGIIASLTYRLQVEANATAYADARVREERAIGFQPPTPA
jgi:hypothetical protein